MTDLSRIYFDALSQPEREAAIRRLAESGLHESTIAHATGLSVEMIRRVLEGTCGSVRT